MLFFTDRFFFVFSTFQFVGLASLIFPSLLTYYLFSWPPILLWFLIDYRGLRQRQENWTAEVNLGRALELGKSMEVEFSFFAGQGGSWFWPHLQLVTPVLRTLRFEEARLGVPLVEENGRSFYRVNAAAQGHRLGYERLGEIKVLAYSRRRWFCRELTVPLLPALEFRVLPSKNRISAEAFQELTLNQRMLYQGTRQVLRGRAAELFYSSRKYQFPDPIRHIDAKKTAKFGQLMTRVYDNFYNQNLILALDCGRAMLGGLSGSQKHDYYLSACLALAQDAHEKQDRLNFVAFSQKVHYLIRGAQSLVSFEPLFRGSRELRLREEESNYDLLVSAAQQLSGQRSVFLIFSDITKPSVQESLLRVLPSICHRHLVAVVALRDEAYSLEREVLDFDEPKVSLESYNHFLYCYWQNEQLELFKRKLASFSGAALLISQRDWLGVVSRLYATLRQSMSL